MVQVGLDGLKFFVEDVDLVLQLAQLGLDLDIWPRLQQGALELVDLVVQPLLLVLIDVASGQLPLLLIDPVPELFDGVALALAGLPQLVVPRLQAIKVGLYLFLDLVEALDLFSELNLNVDFFPHGSGVLRDGVSAGLLALRQVADQAFLLVEEGSLLGVEHLSFCLEFVEALVVLLLGGLFEQLLGRFGDLGLLGDVFLVIVEFGPLVSGRAFLLGPDGLRRTLVLVFLLLLLGLLLKLLLVLLLLSERLGRVDQPLLNILLGHVLRHYI